MALNFGILKDVKVNTVSRFKAWSINEVNSVTARVEHIQGKKDPSKSYNILKIKWEGPKGYYEESQFFPETAKDGERPHYDNPDGTKTEYPSTLEHAMGLIKITAYAVSPKGQEKMSEMSPKFKSFNDVCTVFIKLLDSMKGKVNMQLKLVGKTNSDGNVVACLPKFCGINKETGHFFIFSDPIMGASVDFTKWENAKKAEFEKTVPTNMDKVDVVANTEEATINNDLKGLNTNDLLDSLDSINLDQ